MRNKKAMRKLASKAIAEMQFKKRKTFNRYHSAYGMKHIAEYYMRNVKRIDGDAYISEEAFIKAMLKAGFDSRVDKYNRTYFNVSNVEVNKWYAEMRAY